jgi:hypothetical protein
VSERSTAALSAITDFQLSSRFALGASGDQCRGARMTQAVQSDKVGSAGKAEGFSGSTGLR